MALAGNLITKSQLACFAEGKGYIGLPSFQKELSEKSRVSQILIEKEGVHQIGNAIALGSLTLVAAVCAIWLFITHGHEAYFPVGCLATVSIVSVAAFVATWVLTRREQKKQQSQFDEKANATVPIKDAFTAMEQADVHIIHEVLGHLTEAQRKMLISDPGMIPLVNQKGRSCALSMLSHLSPDQDAGRVQELLQIAGILLDPEEAQICMCHPKALTHLISQDEEYARNFIEFVTQYPSDRAFALLVQALPTIFNPRKIFVVYATWDKEKQNQFLQELTDTRTNPAACDAIVAYIQS